jgi:hypothetical protein
MARTDFLSRQRNQITARLNELRPLYEEYLTLEKAHEALQDLGEPIRRVARRGPGRPRGSRNRSTASRTTARRSTTRKTTGRKPGRPATRPAGGRASTRTTARRSGGRRRSSSSSRADQTLAAIKAKPGSTIPELASALKIRPNYLYRVTAQLQRERKVRKRGKEFHPA